VVLGVGVHALFGARKRLEIDTPQLLVGNPVIPSGRRPFTKHKAPKPKTKQSHRIVCAMAKKKCKGICAQQAEILGRSLGRGRGRNAEGAWNEILSGFAATSVWQQNRTPVVASQDRSDVWSARVSARSWCAAQCARKGGAVRTSSPSRARYGAQRWRQARADALSLDPSAWRAVQMICATARGSDVFTLAQGFSRICLAMSSQVVCGAVCERNHNHRFGIAISSVLVHRALIPDR